ncbi:MAG: energy transducer TonB [Saprospiraceae bacterium]
MNLPAITIDGTQLLLACLGILIGMIMLIFGWRRWLHQKSQQLLATAPVQNKLLNRTKYAIMDIFRWRDTFLRFGLSIALGMTILAFSWTTYERPQYGQISIEDAVDLDVAPPITTTPPPPPPPPPPPIIEPVVDEELIEEEQPEFEDRSIDVNTKVVAPPVAEQPKFTPPPPPAEVEPDIPDFFVVVEEMPSFPGCEDIFDKNERKQCSDKNLLMFLSQNIKYPAMARENNIEGQAVIRFIVETDGTITNAEIVRDLAGGCGKEALRVVNLMNDKNKIWSPGKQLGRPVRVQFNLPIKFQLQ